MRISTRPKTKQLILFAFGRMTKSSNLRRHSIVVIELPYCEFGLADSLGLPYYGEFLEYSYTCSYKKEANATTSAWNRPKRKIIFSLKRHPNVSAHLNLRN